MWMLVACNRFGEVVGYYGTQSTSLEEVKAELKELGRRARAAGKEVS
jgi:hypothetical protein